MQNESLKTKVDPIARAVQAVLQEAPFASSRPRTNQRPISSPWKSEAMSVTAVSEPGAAATGSRGAIDSLDSVAAASGTDIVASRADAPTTRLAGRPGNESSERSKSPVAQISCLRILALALLRQVENLEQRTANNQSADLNVELEVRAFEAELIRSALEQTGGRQRRAARLLGMKVTTLNAKIRRYEIVFERAHGWKRP
jgi:DNA-binding protein Fis